MNVVIPRQLKPAMHAKKPDTSKVLTRADALALLKYPPKGIFARIAKKLSARPEPQEDAKDIVNDTISRFIESPGRFVGMRRQAFLEKLLGDALGRAKDFLELRANNSKFTFRFPEVTTGEDKGKIIYDLRASWPTWRCHETTTAHERRADVRIALKNLSEQQQQIVRLIVEGYTYEDIGELMGGWSKSDIHRRWEEIESHLASRLEVPEENIRAMVESVVESEYVKVKERPRDHSAGLAAAGIYREQGRLLALRLDKRKLQP